MPHVNPHAHVAPAPRPQEHASARDAQRIVQGFRDFFGARARTEASLAQQWVEIHQAEDRALTPDDRATGVKTGAAMMFRLLAKVKDAGQVSHERQTTGLDLLRAMATDEAFRQSCYAQARTGLDNCHDNAVVQFETLCRELAFQGARSTADFVNAARNEAATSLLRDFATRHFPGFGEVLEIHQYLMVKLQRALGLPESGMRYAQFAETVIRDRLGIGAREFVDQARRHVQAGMVQRISETLFDRPLWEAHLRDRYTEQIDQCKASIFTALEALGDSSMSGQQVLVRADGLGNIAQDTDAAAMRRLTELCVDAALRYPAQGEIVQALRNARQSVQRLAGAPDASLVTEIVRHQVDAGRLSDVADRATEQAARWSEPTRVLAGDQWGRRADGDRADPRVDPVGHHLRQHTAQPPPGRDASLQPPSLVTTLLNDPEELALQQALIDTLGGQSASQPRRDAPAAAPSLITTLRNDPDELALQRLLLDNAGEQAAARPAAGLQTFHVDRGTITRPAPNAAARDDALETAFVTLGLHSPHTTVQPPGALTIELAHDRIRRLVRDIERQSPHLQDNIRDLVAPGQIRSMLAPARLSDPEQNALATHAAAAYLDLLRMMVKDGRLPARDVLRGVLQEGEGVDPGLSVIARHVAQPSANARLTMAQGQLAHAATFLLRRLAVNGEAGAVHAALLQQHAGTSVLDVINRDRSSQGASRLMSRMLRTVGLAPPLGNETLEQLHAGIQQQLQRIERDRPPSVRSAVDTRTSLQQVLAQLRAVIMAEADRVLASARPH